MFYVYKFLGLSHHILEIWVSYSAYLQLQVSYLFIIVIAIPNFKPSCLVNFWNYSIIPAFVANIYSPEHSTTEQYLIAKILENSLVITQKADIYTYIPETGFQTLSGPNHRFLYLSISLAYNVFVEQQETLHLVDQGLEAHQSQQLDL